MTTTPIVVRATSPRPRRERTYWKASTISAIGDRVGAARGARRQPEQHDGAERARAGGEQEHAADAEPRQPDEHAGERRGDDPHRLLRRLAEHDCFADLVVLDDLGDEGDACREVQGEGRRLQGAGERGASSTAMTSVTTASPTKSDETTRIETATRSTLRFGKRSAATPPHGVATSMAIPNASITPPRPVLLPVRSRASHHARRPGPSPRRSPPRR